MVSLCLVSSSGDIHCGSEESHLLTIDYSETGPLEISVTFSRDDCNKTTIAHTSGKWSIVSLLIAQLICTVGGILANVTLSSRILAVESRDCIARSEYYSIVITITNTYTGLNQTVNIPFNTTVQYPLVDDLTPLLIRVNIVYTPSNTIIDEWDPEIMYTPPTPGTDPGYCLIVLQVKSSVC